MHAGSVDIGVYNCDGALYAIEDRCSHDDGPLCEGEWEPGECIAICPRHGAALRRPHRPSADPARVPTGQPPIPVRVVDGVVKVDV